FPYTTLFRSSQLPDHIAVRAHVISIPFGERGFVHRKPVMMLGNWDDIFGARFFEQCNPSCRIKLFGFEHRYEIFIAEFILRAVGLYMMFILRCAGQIHLSRIPLRSKRRNRVYSPMNKYAKLG